MYFFIFGLTLRSNEAIPGLAPLEDLPAADVDVDFGGPFPSLNDHTKPSWMEWYVSSGAPQSDGPVLRVWRYQDGAYYRLRYADGIEFIIDRRGTQVWARGPGKASLEDVAYYLLGPVLGFLLRLRGITCLHASAIEVDGQVLAFMGPACAGKSTTAAAFARLGYPVLTDDITALEETQEFFWVLPGAPRLCLWPDSVTALYGSPEALPRLTHEDAVDPEWDKRWLDLAGPEYLFQSQPLPLEAIYLLGERALTGPSFEAVTGKASMLALLANTYSYYLLEKVLRAQEFEALSRLLGRVPIRRVTPHPDPACLSRMCELIVEDFQSCRLLIDPRKKPY